MTPWTDYEELRVIGDMLASQDFCGGMNPVLVVQWVRVGHGSIISDMVSDGRTLVSCTSSKWDYDFLGSMNTRKDRRI